MAVFSHSSFSMLVAYGLVLHITPNLLDEFCFGYSLYNSVWLTAFHVFLWNMANVWNFHMANILNLKVTSKSNHKNNMTNDFLASQYPTNHKSHGAEGRTVDNASFKIVAAAILDLMVRTKSYYKTKTDINIEFPGPEYPMSHDHTALFSRRHYVFGLSVHVFVRPERFLGWNGLGMDRNKNNGLKHGMLVYTTTNKDN